ncbi:MULTISPECIES: hypothetical protein [Caballeronia]|jgi:hypothetical protein|uniref:Uncharacterized protein n=1 Tax=Caballeronia zhejiangensis TaxID=871203 RepID=A0A656QUG9_9BURK|nr:MULTISPECIES: hypothetical protein [Caballeronia]EKS70580.1 hypothetical protein BURK_011708 [Burkholderia sp. SJ98]KDR34243.1 hypothetical protein BG60_00215 [Caballeronia zhejiangensis]MCG7405131.1 hypothetical protein [Caballeronia zhejiangensis]MCI1047288.1 hypothetical protein [Caballeronia zhejiangensis]MDR5788488.1 hypothetical protein [Caballeronia sp. LP003]
MANTKALEELARLDLHIENCGRRIVEQTERLESLRQCGWNTDDSESLLRNLITSLRALDQLRKTVVKEVDEADH